MEKRGTEARAKKSVLRSICRAVVWVLGPIFLLFMLMVFLQPYNRGPSSILGSLVIGWMKFIGRTVPLVSWNWDLVGMTLIGAMMILFGGHRFFSWLVSRIGVATGKNWRWQWRWTWSGLAAVVVSFVIGMSVAGVIHQLGWIAASSESLYERKGRYRLSEMKQLAMEWQLALNDAEDDFSDARHLFKHSQTRFLYQSGGGDSLVQIYQVLLVEEGPLNVGGIIIFPRENRNSSPRGGYYHIGNEADVFPTEKLPELLEKHREHLLAL